MPPVAAVATGGGEPLSSRWLQALQQGLQPLPAARKLIDKVHFSSNGGFSQNVVDGPVPYKIFGKHVTNNQIIYFLLYNSCKI